MADVPANVINELFVSKLDQPEGREKLAAEGSAFIRTKLREVSFARKIINPVYVTKADLQRSVQHDGLVKIVDIEPDSAAMAINFRGGADTRYVEGERYEIPFFMITSEDFQKTEEELLAYEMPITDVIERNSVKDIQEIEDSAFITRVNAAIAVSGKSNVAVTTSGGYIDKTVFATLFNLLEAGGGTVDRLKTEVVLMNNQDYNDLLLWEANSVGDQVGAEITVNGYTYATLFGKRLIVTNKADLVPAKTIYAFAAQEFLGNFFILNDTRFWIDKKKNLVTWSAYESIGMGIGNIRAVASVTWTSA
ncbi:hypothetical protein AYK24_00255 [Thermoplasmatales archaeon SG8-52-4]|nr:MAG: hypothetical protein AYK24_00255 [Thermoplasmatales archaeon SG8-52-4]